MQTVLIVCLFLCGNVFLPGLHVSLIVMISITDPQETGNMLKKTPHVNGDHLRFKIPGTQPDFSESFQKSHLSAFNVSVSLQ